jgi:D-alanyl-D-alanine dipeptidase
LSTKAEFYPHLTKKEIFDQGYLFERSSHSRGSTVDLTLIIIEDGLELDMGSAFDFFDEISWTDSPNINETQRRNRTLLRKVMTENGFESIATEWWHFTLVNEPYPDTYFDFLI